jgi:hypothetical protein
LELVSLKDTGDKILVVQNFAQREIGKVKESELSMKLYEISIEGQRIFKVLILSILKMAKPARKRWTKFPPF